MEGITLKSHIFTCWENIPDVSHLRKIKNNYIDAFDRTGNDDYFTNDICFVAYVMKNEQVVAFGSATYFAGDHNAYEDDDCDWEECEILQPNRRLWVDGLVSIEKGCGRLVLTKLYEWLVQMANEKNVDIKMINIMSVEESVGFYEECGFVEVHTCPHWGGTGNIRVAKLIEDYKPAPCDDLVRNTESKYYEECLVSAIAIYIVSGRRIPLHIFIDVPKNVACTRIAYEQYVTEHLQNAKMPHLWEAIKEELEENDYGL